MTYKKSTIPISTLREFFNYDEQTGLLIRAKTANNNKSHGRMRGGKHVEDRISMRKELHGEFANHGEAKP